MRLRSRNALSRGDGVGGKDEDCGEDEKDEDDDAPFAGSPWQRMRCRGKKDPGSADGDAMADDAGDDEEDEKDEKDEKDEDDDAISEARDEVGRGAEGDCFRGTAALVAGFAVAAVFALSTAALRRSISLSKDRSLKTLIALTDSWFGEDDDDDDDDVE